MGIEVTLALFSRQGLINLFETINKSGTVYTENVQRMLVLQDDYINTIDAVIIFLQPKAPVAITNANKVHPVIFFM